MEVLFTACAYLFQIGIILLCASLLTAGASIIVRHAGLQFKWNGKLVWGCIAALLFALVAWWAYHPPVFCEPELRSQVSDAEYEELAQTLCEPFLGLYSKQLPLWPLYLSVRSVEEDHISAIVYYFPSGELLIEYTSGEGYSSNRHPQAIESAKRAA